MPEWLIGAIGMVGVPIVGYLFGLLLPRDRTHKWGYRVGRILTVFMRQKCGTPWETAENRVQSTISDFIDGIHEGLDSDDK